MPAAIWCSAWLNFRFKSIVLIRQNKTSDSHCKRYKYGDRAPTWQTPAAIEHQIMYRNERNHRPQKKIATSEGNDANSAEAPSPNGNQDEKNGQGSSKNTGVQILVPLKLYDVFGTQKRHANGT